MKVAINVCYGGFSLSPEAVLKLHERGVKEVATPVEEYFPPERRAAEDDSVLGYGKAIKGWKEYLENRKGGKRDSLFVTVFSPDGKYVLSQHPSGLDRHHPELIRVIEEMGEAADGACAKLRIVEVPDGVDYEIDEYDGNEHIAEKHRTWR